MLHINVSFISSAFSSTFLQPQPPWIFLPTLHYGEHGNVNFVYVL
jgi:hypothetical protein